jgi:hypothetical protein
VSCPNSSSLHTHGIYIYGKLIFLLLYSHIKIRVIRVFRPSDVSLHVSNLESQKFNLLGQRFSNFFEVGTTFLSQNSSADHLTLVPFESKFIIFLAYFNTSILIF